MLFARLARPGAMQCRVPAAAPLFAAWPSLHSAPRPAVFKDEALLTKRPARWHRRSVATRAMGGDPEEKQRSVLEQRDFDQKLILGMGLGLTSVILLAAQFGGDSILELAAWEGVDVGGEGSLGAGDFVGGLLWSLSLYFASPWQLLLLFFGLIETERPSDGVLRFFGQLGGLRVDDIDYQAPSWVRGATVAVFAASGFAVAAAMGVLLGDASWSVSTGLGSCFAAGMYEVGRPRRLSVEEAQLLERQYQDFVAFAEDKLQKSGRCHESEVIRGFRRAYGRYRQESGISDATIRDMVRNWHPQAERSGQGYYKGLSLRPWDSPAATEQQRPAAAGSGSGSTVGGSS